MGTLKLELVRHPASADLPADRRSETGRETAVDAVVEVEACGRIVRAAGNTEVLLGRTPTELDGLEKGAWLAPGQHAAFDALAVAASQARVSAELAVLLPDGRQRVADVTFVPARFAGAPVLRLVVRARTRQALEDALVHAEEVASERDRLATIGQLVAGIAHEVRTPLAYLRSNLDFVEDCLADLRDVYQAPEAPAGAAESLTADLRNLVAESKEGIERLTQLAQALQGTARRQTDESFDPARSVSEAVTIFRGARRGECEVFCQVDALPALRGSSGALGQVLLNLLQNGLDAMGGRGNLEVTGKRHEDKVEIAVRDQGTGIPLELHTTIFEPYFTTKPIGKGTGLGLPICRRIVEEMGGTLGFETSSAGTVFRICIPALE